MGAEVLAWLADLSTLPPLHHVIDFIPVWATVHNQLDSMMFLMLYYTNFQSILLINGVHDSDEARRLLGHKAWLRGSDYATVLGPSAPHYV